MHVEISPLLCGLRLGELLRISTRPGWAGKANDMDDWWKYGGGALTVFLGAIIKDAFRDGQLRERVDHLEQHAKKVCVCDGQCSERRKDCNSSLRREMDIGTERFDRIEGKIDKLYEIVIGLTGKK
jgi:hypothetical protein